MGCAVGMMNEVVQVPIGGLQSFTRAADGSRTAVNNDGGEGVETQ